VVEKIKQALERAYQERTGISVRSQEDSIATGFDMLGGSSASDVLRDAETRKIDTKNLALKRIITFDNSDSGVESYRLLRTQLIRKMQVDHLVSIGITSPNANEGKTLTSVNLAISLAKTADIDVILVDGDITHPSVHNVLGINSKYGLVDLLKGDAGLPDAVLKLNIPNLWLIPGRFEGVSLLDSANSNRIESLVNNLTFSERNLVIFDLPPVLSKDDTLAIAACLDGIILVVEEGSTKSDEVSRSVELLKQGTLIGTVMNKYSRHQMTYY
jgi:capsular exopolysaccharide synthesis family protein